MGLPADSDPCLVLALVSDTDTRANACRREISMNRCRTPRDRGASSVEYGLLITGIAVVIVAAVFLFGGGVSDLFSDSCDTINQQVNQSSC